MNDTLERDPVPPPNPEYVRRYVLGELSEAESDRLEQRCRSESVVRELVDTVSDDLCDDYVRGHLSGRERALVEALAESGPWRERLRFARVLVTELDSGLTGRAAQPRPGSPAPPPAAINLFRAFWRQPAGLQAAAVLTLVLLGSGWPLAWTSRAASHARLEQERAAAQRQVTALRGSLDSEQLRVAELERRVAEQSTVTFSLFDRARRGRARDAVVVPAGASFVRFELGTEAGVPMPYIVEIRDRNGRLVWSLGVHDSTDVGGGPVPTVRVPASVLVPDRYDLRLLADRGTGRSEEVARFMVEVERR